MADRVLSIPYQRGDEAFSAAWTLQGVRIVFEFRWDESPRRWRVDIYEGDGETPVKFGAVMVAGGGPDALLPTWARGKVPPGMFIVEGAETGSPDDLLGALRLIYREAI